MADKCIVIYICVCISKWCDNDVAERTLSLDRRLEYKSSLTMMTTHITTQSQLTKIPLIEMRNVCVLFPDGSARIKYPYLNLSYIYAYRRVWEFNGHFVSVAYVVELVSSHMSHTQRTYVRNGPNFKFCLTLRPFSTLEDQSIFKTVRSTVYIYWICSCGVCVCYAEYRHDVYILMKHVVSGQ